MITLSKSGNSVTFTFENNGHYLANGTIDTPVNGLILVTDESEMASFLKIDGDPFISCLYSDLGMTKAELISWYEENMVGSTGGGGGGITSGEVQTMIDESISGKADTSKVDINEKVTATALVDLNDRLGDKADTSAVTASIGVVTAALQTKLDATAYTPVTVATQVQEDNPNPVSSNAVYGKTTITTTTTGEQESGNLQISNGEGGLDQSSIDDWIWGDPDHSEDSWANGKAIFTLSHISYLDVTVRETEESGNGGFRLEYNNGTASCSSGTAVISGDTSGTFKIIVSGFTPFSFGDFDGSAVAEGSYDDNLECGGECGSVYINIIYTATVENTEWVKDIVSAKTPYWDAKLDASAITSSVTSASTDSQVPSAKAVYDALQEGGGGGLPESAFTTYTASTDARLAEDEEVTAAALNTINDALSGKQDTLIAGSGITIDSANTISCTVTGGGATYSAGTNISIDTGNTISCTLPISYPTGYKSIAVGDQSTVSGTRNIVCGQGSNVKEKSGNFSRPNNSIAVGYYVNAWSSNEASFGKYNDSKIDTSVGGVSATTCFSVGNGTDNNARHNAFEIRQNGDIYCNNGTADVKLQDYLQIKVMAISQADYDALVQGGTVDANTLYVINNVV